MQHTFLITPPCSSLCGKPSFPCPSRIKKTKGTDRSCLPISHLGGKTFLFSSPLVDLAPGDAGSTSCCQRGEEQVLLVYKSLCYTPWSRVLALNHRTLGFLSLPSVQSTLSWLYEALCLAMRKQISGYLLLDNVFWEQLTSFTATTI